MSQNKKRMNSQNNTEQLNNLFEIDSDDNNKVVKPVCFEFLNMNIEMPLCTSLNGESNSELQNVNYVCINDENSMCNFCGGKYKKSAVTYVYNVETKKQIKTMSCILCNSVVNFKNLHIGKCFLVSSDMSQNKINSLILNNFNSNGKILSPSEIDKKAQLINYSIYEFINAYSLMTNNEKSNFSNFKMMFTSNVISSLKSTGFVNYFSACDDDISIKKHDNSYFDRNNYYKMNDTQNKILLKYVKKFKDSNLQLTNMTINSIAKKIQNSKNIQTIIMKMK